MTGTTLTDTTPRPSVGIQLDDYDVAGFAAVAARFGMERFGFVVTPNVDHFIRLHDDAQFRQLYRQADFVLLDSRFAAYLLRVTRRLRLAVCPGSDLTAQLLAEVARPGDRIVVVGGSAAQIEQLAQRHGLQLTHHEPPMGFIGSPQALEACLQFVEAASPFRFCFLAVGSPQQERVASLLKERGLARGLAFCVGGSLNFLTGVERRAPRWMQRLGLEWLFRLLQSPRRLAGRYLIRGPRFFRYLGQMRIGLRRPPAADPGAPR